MKRLELSVFLLVAVIMCLATPACNRNGGGKRVIAVIPKHCSARRFE